MYIIGIDPGNKGGIACLETNHNNQILRVSAYPYNDDQLINVAKYYCTKETRIWIEKQGIRMQDSKRSCFGIGRNYGKILGILYVYYNNENVFEVHPSTWKRVLEVTKDKQTSIDKVYQLFPGTSLKPTNRYKKPHDGMAEALLIAEYGRIQNENNR